MTPAGARGAMLGLITAYRQSACVFVVAELGIELRHLDTNSRAVYRWIRA